MEKRRERLYKLKMIKNGEVNEKEDDDYDSNGAYTQVEQRIYNKKKNNYSVA
jgi:hypothetical protein